jgi:hypothetical protein
MRELCSICLVVAACAGSHPGRTTAGPPTATGVGRLQKMPTIFISITAVGRLPPLPESVGYELCVELASGKLVDVRDPDSKISVEGVVPNVLRGWRWRMDSSQRIKTGVICWVERFTPSVDKDGKQFVRAEPAAAVHALKLEDDEQLVETAEPDHGSLLATRILEEHGVRYVILVPRLFVELPGGPPQPPDPDRPPVYLAAQKIAGDDPHLPNATKIRLKGMTARAVYKICVDQQGRVFDVVPLLPIVDAHDSIVRTLKTWRYRPQPIPVCFVTMFNYTID